MVTSEQLQEEAARMARAPGIVFIDDSGRRAIIAGTGLGVEEIVKAYETMDEDWSALREAFHWLSEEQLRAALLYYRTFPDEIDSWLRHDRMLEEYVLAHGPLVPPYPREYLQLLGDRR